MAQTICTRALDPLNARRGPIASALATALLTTFAIALTTAGATLLTPLAARAGAVRGVARVPVTSALPADAVFEAVLLDAALADAPSRELGRVRLQPAGPPPFRFTIPYRERDLRPGDRYTVRGTIRQGERLLFTTDTFTPVELGGASAPVTLRLVPVGSGRAPAAGFPLGRLPASWRGELAGAGSPSRWQVDLLTDGSFQLRQTFPGRPVPNVFDDLGRWRLEPGGPRLGPGSQRLVLRGGREAPLFFQPLDGGAALRKLDLQGAPSRARQPDRLQRLATFAPIDPRLHLQGLFVYLADAASLRLCATGARLPVAMEGDYRRLEEAYRKARPAGAAGQPLLVHLEGLITERPSAEPSQPPRRTVVVERFVGVHPGRGCPVAEET